MAASSAQRNYARTAFVATPINTPINVDALRAAIAALPLSVPASNVLPNTVGGATVFWDDYPSNSDRIAVDAVVAAHPGFTTTALLQQFNSTGDTTNATSSYAPKQVTDFISQPLVAGEYLLRLSGHVKMDVANSATGVQAIVRAGISGSLSGSDDRAYTEDSFASSTIAQLYTVSDVFVVTEGTVLRWSWRFRRLGASGTVTASNCYTDLLRIPRA